jgi:hypothetical protein
LQQQHAERRPGQRQRQRQRFAQHQPEDLTRPRAHGPQNRHFPAPLVEAGQQRREHHGQSHQHHQPRHDPQRVFRQAQQIPELLQGQAGQDRQQRFGGEFVDLALHPENRGLGFEANQESRDGLRSQIELAHLFGGQAHSGNGCAAEPNSMNRLDTFQADVYGLVHRRAGARQDADHLKRLVVVQRETKSRRRRGR